MASFDYDVRLGETLAVPWCTPWWPSEARWWSQVRSGHRIKETRPRAGATCPGSKP